MDFNFDIDEDLFDEIEVDIDEDFESRVFKPAKTKQIAEHNLKYSNAAKLANDIVLDSDSRYFVVVNGSFYFGDFIEALVVNNNWHIKKMTISTLSLCQNNVDSLLNLIKGNYVDSLNLIVSDYFFSHERRGLIPYIYEKLDIDNKFQLAVAGTHCKLCIFETHCGKFVVIHGSANLRSSSNIEQIVVEESRELYEFNNEYQDKIIEAFKTINKSIRGKKLWHQVAQDQEGAQG